MKCSASVTLSKGKTRRPSSYTREGTAAHLVAEMHVHGLVPPDEIEVDGEMIEVTDDMIEHVGVYVYCVDSLRRSSDAFFTEARVEVSGLPEPVFGTADTIAYDGAKWRVDVVDLKYGKGVYVPVKDNPQLRIYGLGALEKIEATGARPKTVRMAIVQPRLSGGPSVEFEEIDVDTLRWWSIEELHPATLNIAMGDTREVVGPHCRWCVRAGECKSLARQTQALAKEAFAPDPAKVVHGLPNGELAAILDKAEMIVSWINLVRGEASHRADLGQTIPGWKLVARRAVRKWRDPETVLDELDKLGVPMEQVTKILSPTAVERVMTSRKLSTKALQSFIEKTSSGSTLVKSEDQREETLALTPKSVFNPIP
jgi:hypothetical protein